VTLPLVPQRTTPGFVFSTVDRALYECLAIRKFGQKEMDEFLAFFNTNPPECVFCGAKDVKRWDHLFPISKGGDTVLGNMVLACSQCDDSKQGRLFEEWILSNAPLSPKSRGVIDLDQRIGKIKEYISHINYHPRTLEERLNTHELETLNKIRSGLRETRRDIEKLINDYRARVDQR